MNYTGKKQPTLMETDMLDVIKTSGIHRYTPSGSARGHTKFPFNVSARGIHKRADRKIKRFIP